MTAMRRRALAIALIAAGPALVALGFANAPSASACARINDFNQALGEGPTCSTTPSAPYLWLGAALLLAGLLVLIPWWRRLVQE